MSKIYLKYINLKQTSFVGMSSSNAIVSCNGEGRIKEIRWKNDGDRGRERATANETECNRGARAFTRSRSTLSRVVIPEFRWISEFRSREPARNREQSSERRIKATHRSPLTGARFFAALQIPDGLVGPRRSSRTLDPVPISAPISTSARSQTSLTFEHRIRGY